VGLTGRRTGNEGRWEERRGEWGGRRVRERNGGGEMRNERRERRRSEGIGEGK